jgi:hypothetical protein
MEEMSVEERLADWPRSEPVWLPTYAPWLSPIEKLWRWLCQAVLKMHRLTGDWPELHQRVNTFLDQFATGSTAYSVMLAYWGMGSWPKPSVSHDYWF